MGPEDVELPATWVLSKLGDIVAPVKEKVDPSLVPTTPYVGLEHVEAHSMRLLGQGVGSDVKSAKTRFRPGDVLYGKLRPYLNKVTRLNFAGICSTDFLVFSDSPELDSSYLAYYLNQQWVADQAHHLSSGVSLPRVDWKSLSTLPIAYPSSKVHQEEIVATIDATRSHGLEAATHLDLVRHDVARLRTAILAAACSGRLTGDWREAHAGNADGLREHLRQLRRHHTKRPAEIAADDLPDIPDSWSWVSVDSIASAVVDGVHKTPDYLATGIPFVTVRSLTAGPGIDLSQGKFISEADHKLFTRRTAPQRGDILISKDGTIGVTRAVRTDDRFSIFVSVAMVKPLDYSMTDYLEIAFQSPQVQAQMVGVGSGLKHLVIRDLKADALPLPPLDEQDEIVRRASALLARADELSRDLDSAGQKVARTRQAVLAKAFRGELVAAAGR